MLIDFVDESGNILLQSSSKRWDTLFWHPYGETSFLPPGTRNAIVHLNSYRKTANGYSNDAAFEHAFFALKTLEEPHPFGKNLLMNPSAETGDLEGWNVSGYMQALANEVEKTRSISGNYIFANNNVGSGSASQSIDLTEYQDDIDASRFSVKWGGYMRDFRGDQPAEIKIELLDRG